MEGGLFHLSNSAGLGLGTLYSVGGITLSSYILYKNRFNMKGKVLLELNKLVFRWTFGIL